MSGVVNYTSTYTQSVTLADLEVTNADTDLKIKNTSDSSPENVTVKVRFRDTNDANAMTIGIDNNAVELKNECSNGTAKLSSGVKNLTIDESANLSTFNTDLKSNSVKLAGSTSGILSVLPTAVTSTHTLTMPAAQGSSGELLANDGSGNLSWDSIWPKRWEFGTTAFKWNYGFAYPAGMSTYGNAGSAVGNRYSYLYLTADSANQNGVFHKDFGSNPSWTDFEMRFDMRVNKGGAGGADTFFAFANATSSTISGETNTGGHVGVVNHYSGTNWFTKIYNATTDIATDTDKHSYTVDDDQYHHYFLRRIGNVITFGTISGDNSASWSITYTDTSAHPTGQYFGVGAKTGGNSSHHVMTYIELRYFGTNNIGNEVD